MKKKYCQFINKRLIPRNYGLNITQFHKCRQIKWGGCNLRALLNNDSAKRFVQTHRGLMEVGEYVYRARGKTQHTKVIDENCVEFSRNGRSLEQNISISTCCFQFDWEINSYWCKGEIFKLAIFHTSQRQLNFVSTVYNLINWYLLCLQTDLMLNFDLWFNFWEATQIVLWNNFRHITTHTRQDANSYHFPQHSSPFFQESSVFWRGPSFTLPPCLKRRKFFKTFVKTFKQIAEMKYHKVFCFPVFFWTLTDPKHLY